MKIECPFLFYFDFLDSEPLAILGRLRPVLVNFQLKAVNLADLLEFVLCFFDG
jgi:hypothetical protein